MPLAHYIYNGKERLRCGYTTGTCAALAAQAAVTLLLTSKVPLTAALVTPAGVAVEVAVRDAAQGSDWARAAVAKDAGDDWDVTDGLLIVAEARRTAAGFTLAGGAGVGRVTRPGLEQPVGAAAINRVPRAMIQAEVETVCARQHYAGGIAITISVPGGEAAAKRTFNANLGIEGGISIIGTSGIVEPKSLAALLDSIELEIRQQAACGARRLILTPGNYGQDFLKNYPWLQHLPCVSCANFIGEALDLAARYEFQQVLLVGHIGKLVKLAGGVMNTHSRVADCRVELFAAHAALCGARRETVAALMAAATTDACLELLAVARLQEPVLASLCAAVGRQLERRVDAAYAVGALLFSNQYGFLGQTPETAKILREMEGN